MGSTTVPEPLPHWNVNVPPSLRTPTCPDFLLNLNPKDLGIISTPDALYTRLTWPAVRAIIATNRIDLFQRVPSDLRRYLDSNHTIRLKHGSVLDFIVGHRLHWTVPIAPRGAPFEYDDDYRVLYNDWPYGIDERIVHLVVWTKFVLEDDVATGELTDRARREVDAFVGRTFGVGDHVGFCWSVEGDCWYGLLTVTLGDLVQELGLAEVDSRRGAFPCYALRSGPGVREGGYWRGHPLVYALDGIMTCFFVDVSRRLVI